MDNVIKLAPDAAPPAGYVLAVREKGLHAGRYAVAPRGGCADCYGRGFITTTAAHVEGVGPTQRIVNESVQRPCGCVGGRLHRALDVGSSGSLTGPPAVEPLVTPSDPDERQAARVARLSAEVAAAEVRLSEAEAARAAALAPHLERVAAAEIAAATARTAVATALAEANAAEVALLAATEALADATARQAQAQVVAEAADAALSAAQDALAPLAMVIDAARRAADQAGNRGHRHRIEVAQQRLTELRARLARVTP